MPVVLPHYTFEQLPTYGLGSQIFVNSPLPCHSCFSTTLCAYTLFEVGNGGSKLAFLHFWFLLCQFCLANFESNVATLLVEQLHQDFCTVSVYHAMLNCGIPTT